MLAREAQSRTGTISEMTAQINTSLGELRAATPEGRALTRGRELGVALDQFWKLNEHRLAEFAAAFGTLEELRAAGRLEKALVRAGIDKDRLIRGMDFTGVAIFHNSGKGSYFNTDCIEFHGPAWHGQCLYFEPANRRQTYGNFADADERHFIALTIAKCCKRPATEIVGEMNDSLAKIEAALRKVLATIPVKHKIQAISALGDYPRPEST